MTDSAPATSAIVTAWMSAPVADALIAAATALYAYLLWRMHRRGEKWPFVRTGWWLLAMFGLVVALNSSMAVYSGQLFWVHMLGHLTLIMIVPVFLIWAQPVRLLRDASTGRVRAAVDRAISSRVTAFLVAPAFAIPLYCAVIVLTHLTGFPQAMATNMWLHHAEVVLYLVSGYLLFLPLVGSEPHARWLSYPLRFVLLALCMGPDTLVGITLMMTNHPVAPAMAESRTWGPSGITDQNIAGAIMWFVGDGLMMLLMIITGFQMARAQKGERGMGSLLDGIRSRQLVGDQFAAGANAAVVDVDADDDAALDAYNARLAALNAHEQARAQAHEKAQPRGR